MLSGLICLSQYGYKIFTIAKLFLQCQFSSVPSISVGLSSKFTDVWMPPTTTTMDSRWLPDGESKMIFVTFQYSDWSNDNTETKWCLDAKMERNIRYRHLGCHHLEFVKIKL